jgi:predicted nucleic acid-binding Zn ribbon protein
MNLYREHKKIAYRKMNDDKAGNIVLRMIKAYGIEGKYFEARSKQLWYEMMGPAIGNYTKNIYVKKNKLYVSLSSASLRQEMNYSKEKIQTYINEALGEEFIREVIIW